MEVYCNTVKSVHDEIIFQYFTTIFEAVGSHLSQALLLIPRYIAASFCRHVQRLLCFFLNLLIPYLTFSNENGVPP